MKDEKKNKAQLIEELRNLRKECEAARQFSAEGKPGSELFRNIVENASDAIVSINTLGTFVFFNRKAEEMFGYTAAEILGKPSYVLIPEGMRDAEASSVTKHRQNQKTGYLASLQEGLALCKNGSLLPIEASYYGYHLNGTYLMTAIIRDISLRKEFERSLEEAKDFSDSIIESSLDSIVITGPNGTITRVNSAFLQLLGLKKTEQVIGQSLENYCPDHEGEYETTTGEPMRIGQDYFQAMQSTIVRLQKGEKLTSVENYHLRADNRIVPVEETICPLFGKNGAIIGTVGVIRDITNRKKAEKELSDSRDFLRHLFDISLEGLLVSDAQGKITMVNDRLAKMLGYAKNDLIGKSLGLFTPVQEKESAIKLVEELRASGALIGLERTWQRVDGSLTDVEINVSLMKDANGTITGAFSSVRDISERKMADMAVRASEERYRRIFENSFVAIEEVDISQAMSVFNELKSAGVRDMRTYLKEHPEFMRRVLSMITIIEANEAALKMFGARDKEELASSTDKIWREEFLPASSEAFIAFAEGKPYFQTESIHHTLQGVQKNILLQINFLIKQRDLNRVLVSLVDITPLKAAEKKLLESQQRLRSLTNELITNEENERRNLGMYLHDRIGQSLSALKIQLEMMASELTGSDDRDTCSRILKQIEATIHDTRVLSYELSPVILHELGLEAALGWLTEQTQKQHTIAVSFKSDKKIRHVDDEVKIILYRAASELLTNVVQHSRAANAAVAIRQRSGQLQITVEDNGVGFDPAEMEGISATDRGFGLFSIKERLHYLGGSVVIRSAPRKGTQIQLLVPLT